MTSAAATRPPTVAEVVAVLERIYPPGQAESWDAVGLVCGEEDAPVESILLAVDTVRTVAAEAIEMSADLVVAHHPLFLRPVSTVEATHPKGRLITDLIRGGTALYVAHTNADIPPGGVSDALASALGLVDTAPLVPRPTEAYDKIVVFVPRAQAVAMVDALAAAGAGTIGDYDRAAFMADGTGTFRPGEGAQPHIGTVGQVEEVPETRVEMILPRRCRAAVVAAMRSAHPYEEPAYDVLELATEDSDVGLGRIGTLPEPMTLRDFVDDLVATLPATPTGARVAGDLDREVRVVAVQGGAGDDLVDVVRAARPDVFVTSDLRHHPVIEFLEYADAPAMVDVSHWAAEWTWLPVAARLVGDALAAQGFAVRTRVSHRVTDPWNHVAHASQRSTS